MPVFKSASSSQQGARWSRPAPWLCALLPLWLVACGPGEEGVPSNEPSSLATQQSPVDMPPADNECHEWTRDYTTTSMEQRVVGAYYAPTMPGTCWYCVDTTDCTISTTWRESFVCMGPTIEGAVLEKHKLSESTVCGPIGTYCSTTDC